MSKASLDIRICHGTVYDGSGSEGVRADVGIRRGRIVVIGDLSGYTARSDLDADGCLVTPGLIDAHSHSDIALLVEPRASSKVFQGVTTEICGNCGASAAPRCGDAPLPSDWQDKPLPGSWRTVADYRSLYDRVCPAIHTALLVGHNSLHRGICGYAPRGATPDELSKMVRILEESLDEGAGGLSFGLIYPPASAVPEEELIALAHACQQRDRICTFHMRSEAGGLEDAVAEVIRIGRRTGVRVHISHLKTSGEANWHRLDRVFDQIESAREEGIDLTADRYPYTAAQTDLDILLPSHALHGGREAILRRLSTPGKRALLREEILEERGEFGLRHVMIGTVETPRLHHLKGMMLIDAAEQAGCEPVDFLLDLIEEDALRTGGIFFGMCEKNMKRILQKPWVMIGSDASLRAPDGPLSADHPHPRAYGTFTRILRNALDGDLLPLAEAIRKMTSFPAERFCLHHRGRIQPGFYADIAVFDPEQLQERTTYAEPHRLSEGVRHLVVNGVPLIEEFRLTGSRNGRFCVHGKDGGR